MELPKYTAEEEELEIPCRIWLPNATRSQLIDLTNIPIEAMTIDVIAHSLSTKARYNGQTPFPYSVAIHSVLVSALVRDEHLELEGLLHDAAEAFVGDLISPIKRESPDFKRVETLVDAQVRAFYGLPLVESEEVKAADTRALWMEQAILQGKQMTIEQYLNINISELELAGSLTMFEFGWRVAREAFENRYQKLVAPKTN